MNFYQLFNQSNCFVGTKYKPLFKKKIAGEQLMNIKFCEIKSILLLTGSAFKSSKYTHIMLQKDTVPFYNFLTNIF